MKNTFKILAAAALVAGLSSTVQAVQITGQIHMTGSATLDDQLANANGATAFNNVHVAFGTQSGSYVGTGGDPVTFNPFSWDPADVPTEPLWEFAGTLTDGNLLNNGWIYSFDLDETSIAVVTQTSTFLNITGYGTLDIAGVGSPYDPTLGAWSFTIDNPGGTTSPTFTFGFASANTALPDGGTTVMLLGSALAGLGLLRKKLVA